MSLSGHGHFAVNSSVRRQRAGLCRGDYPRQRADTLQYLTEKYALLLSRFIASLGQRCACDQDVIGFKAELDVLQCEETAHHESRPHEQHDRQCHLRNY